MLIPGPTRINAAVATPLTVQKNGSTVGTEPNLDFVDGDIVWTVVDDSGNTRVRVTPAIGTSKVTSAMIVDATIATGDIGLLQITNALIAANTIQQTKMALKCDSGKGVSFNVSTAVTFATAFTAAPIVIAGLMVGDPAANSGAGEPANYAAYVDSVTSSGFTLFHNQGGTRTVPWVAIGA